MHEAAARPIRPRTLSHITSWVGRKNIRTRKTFGGDTRRQTAGKPESQKNRKSPKNPRNKKTDLK